MRLSRYLLCSSTRRTGRKHLLESRAPRARRPLRPRSSRVVDQTPTPPSIGMRSGTSLQRHETQPKGFAPPHSTCSERRACSPTRPSASVRGDHTVIAGERSSHSHPTRIVRTGHAIAGRARVVADQRATPDTRGEAGRAVAPTRPHGRHVGQRRAREGAASVLSLRRNISSGARPSRRGVVFQNHLISKRLPS